MLTEYSLSHLVDLCSFRYLTIKTSSNCVLPAGVRDIIKDYVCSRIDDSNIHDAVKLWCSGKVEALMKYGRISMWDVSQVKTMASLFKDQVHFNDDIHAWDVSNVTNMCQMFANAFVFNRPLQR